MINPFQLKGPFGAEYAVAADDVLRTKKALNKLGHLDVPPQGLSTYSDMPMIDGLKRFQRSKGLYVDGVMKQDGPTAFALGQELEKHRTSIPVRPKKARSTFGLFAEIGQKRTNQSRDVQSLEHALKWTGHLSRNQAYIDRGKAGKGLFDAVKRFQKTAGIKVDGWMRPYGETENALNHRLEAKIREARKMEKGKPTVAKRDDQQALAVAAIPAIVYKIAEFFSIAVMAAWVWWQTMSAAERTKVRRQVEGNGSDENRDADCEHLHYNVDIPVCNGISQRRGKQAAAKCFASASERYAACLRGVPIDQLPPLDTWNN